MPVFRYRSVAQMPPPWRAADDPANLHLVAEMMTIHRRLAGVPSPRQPVQRFRTLDEANAARDDVYRRGDSGDR